MEVIDAWQEVLLWSRSWPATRGRAVPGKRTDARCGALKEDEAQRLKALESENARLKTIVAEQALDIPCCKELERGGW